MSALYGHLQGERSEVTRLAHQTITSKLETWNGAIKTELDSTGNYSVYIGTKRNPRVLIATGNVDHCSFAAIRLDGTPTTVRGIDTLNGPEPIAG